MVGSTSVLEQPYLETIVTWSSTLRAVFFVFFFVCPTECEHLWWLDL